MGRRPDDSGNGPSYAILLALAFLALVLRLPLMDESLFGDELFTYDVLNRDSLGDVLRLVDENENSPPLFWLLGWPIHDIGDTRIWIRVPSLVAGVATVPLAYLLGRRALGGFAAAVAAALLAVSPFHAFYSSEARPYALATLFVVLSAFCMLEAVAAPTRLRWWIALALATTAAVYSHYTAALPVAAQAVWALWAHPASRRFVGAAHAAAGAAYLPWLVTLGRNENLEGVGALSAFSIESVAKDLARMFAGHPFLPLRDAPGRASLAVLGVGVAAALAIVLRRGRGSLGRPNPGHVLVAAMAVAAPAGVAAYSLFGDDIFLPRNLVVSLPAAYLLLGALLAAVPQALADMGARRVAATLACTAAAVGPVAAGRLDTAGEDGRRPPWKEIAGVIDQRGSPGDPVVNVELLPVGEFAGRHPLVRSLEVNLEKRRPVLLGRVGDRTVWDRVAHARRVFVVVAQLPNLPGPPPTPMLDRRFRLVTQETRDGLAPISVFEHATSR